MVTQVTNINKLLVIAVIVNFLCVSTGHSDTDITCQYDTDNPTLESAYKAINANKMYCAKKELFDILEIDSPGSQTIIGEAYITLGIILVESNEINSDSLFYYMYNGLKNYPNYKNNVLADPEYENIAQKAIDSLRQDEVWVAMEINDSLMNICHKYNSDKKKNKFLKLMSASIIAGGGIAALIYENKANDAFDSYSVAISPAEINSFWDEYESNRNVRNVMMGVAIAGALTEIWWFLKNPKKPEIDCHDIKRKYDNYQLGFSYKNDGIHLTLLVPNL